MNAALEPRPATLDVPALFVSHGAPTLLVTDSPARRFLSGLGARFDGQQRPRAIVVVSAHWETAEPQLLANPAPETIHDFYGFPAELYAHRYPSPGAPALAERILALLQAAGYPARLDPARGLDHGAWVPLSLMFPAADIPVIQLSINPRRSPLDHWRIGRALRPLGHEGVLVVGSGALTHNLQEWMTQRYRLDAPSLPYVETFSDWLADRLGAGDLESVLGYRELAPAAVRAHPSEDHLLPLFVALGAAGLSWSAQRAHASIEYGVIAMDTYLFQVSTARPSSTPHSRSNDP